MKKIVLFLLIVFVLYTLAVFQFPEFADSFGNKIGLESYNNFVRSFKSTMDKTSTNIPSLDEAKNAYDQTLSGANALKDTFIDGVNTTKTTIDTIRETASGVQDTYNKTVETITTVKQTVDGVTETLSGVTSTLGNLDSMRDGIMKSVNTSQVEASVEANAQAQ